jgi:hypothetical protein
MWDYTRHALRFFTENVNFQELVIDSQSESDFWVLREGNDVFVAYLRNGGSETIDLGSGSFIVRYFNPRTGAFVGTPESVSGPQLVLEGPVESNEDWAVLIERNAQKFNTSDTNDLQRKAKVYPNPTRDFLRIDGPIVLSIEIWTSEGKMVRSLPMNSGRVDATDLPNGIYFLRILFEEGLETHRFIKQ